MTSCLERAREGEPVAVERLVDHLGPRIRKMAAYYAHRCGEDSDDLTQEAWIGLLEALPELDFAVGQPEQYLIARARWRILDTIKRERIRRCSPLDDDAAVCADIGDCPADAACASEFVRQLGSTQRQVLDCLLRGLTFRQAGELLGCASANIAYHVRKIRQSYEEWV